MKTDSKHPKRKRRTVLPGGPAIAGSVGRLLLPAPVSGAERRYALLAAERAALWMVYEKLWAEGSVERVDALRRVWVCSRRLTSLFWMMHPRFRESMSGPVICLPSSDQCGVQEVAA